MHMGGLASSREIVQAAGVQQPALCAEVVLHLVVTMECVLYDT